MASFTEYLGLRRLQQHQVMERLRMGTLARSQVGQLLSEPKEPSLHDASFCVRQRFDYLGRNMYGISTLRIPVDCISARIFFTYRKLSVCFGGDNSYEMC